MSTAKAPELVFGFYSTSPDTEGSLFAPETTKKLFDLLLENGCHTLDSARVYPLSEENIGKSHAGDKFIINSKGPLDLMNGYKDLDNVTETFDTTMSLTGVKKLDIYYLHMPWLGTPLKETLERINEEHKKGRFERFGLSNFKPDHVREVYNVCKENGYVLPTVYQGNYNAVARLNEQRLFPILRELGMAHYAYSPIAGGFLVKTRQQIAEQKNAGRFTAGTRMGDMYRKLYLKDSHLDGLDEWGKIAKEEGISQGELAYRWIRFDSDLKAEYGDAVVFGGSSIAQVEETLGWLQKGPLSEKAKQGIERVWEMVKHDAIVDNSDSVSK